MRDGASACGACVRVRWGAASRTPHFPRPRRAASPPCCASPPRRNARVRARRPRPAFAIVSRRRAEHARLAAAATPAARAAPPSNPGSPRVAARCRGPRRRTPVVRRLCSRLRRSPRRSAGRAAAAAVFSRHPRRMAAALRPSWRRRRRCRRPIGSRSSPTRARGAAAAPATGKQSSPPSHAPRVRLGGPASADSEAASDQRSVAAAAAPQPSPPRHHARCPM